jgi:hypothetical protein
VPTLKALGGPAVAVKPGEDPRKPLADWLTKPDNPYFARSFVNRVWAHYFGVGLVNPVDDFSLANPPTNARLLDALARDFADNGFDIRRLERTILVSRTYQLSSEPNESNKFDKINFARSYIRPLMAEQVVDVLNAGVGVDEVFGTAAANAGPGIPAGRKMVEVGATLAGGNTGLNPQNLAYVLRIFGRPPRTTACDCERAMEPALPQTLFRMTDPAVVAKLRDPKNRIARAVQAKLTPDQAVEELFLATLTRFPTESEKEEAVAHIAAARNKPEALTDVLWALINTREFILNH